MAAEKGKEGGPEGSDLKPLTAAEEAKKTIEQAAEDARLRILGPPGRVRTPAPPPPAEDAALPDGIDDETAETFRRIVDGVEEEIHRLEEQTWRLRAEIDQAGAKLHDELERAADVLVVRAAEDAQREEVHAQQIEALAEAISHAAVAGRRQVEELTQAAAAADAIEARFTAIESGLAAVEARIAGMDSEVTRVAGALAAVPDRPPPADAGDGPFPDIGASLLEALELVAEQLSGFNQRMDHLPDRLAERLGSGDEKTADVLARLADEVGRLRRRLPVRRKLAESTAKSKSENEPESEEQQPAGDSPA